MDNFLLIHLFACVFICFSSSFTGNVHSYKMYVDHAT